LHAEVKSELKEDIANVRTELAEVKSELKEDIHKLDVKISIMDKYLKVLVWLGSSVLVVLIGQLVLNLLAKT